MTEAWGRWEPLEPYKGIHCGHWHIGHGVSVRMEPDRVWNTDSVQEVNAAEQCEDSTFKVEGYTDPRAVNRICVACRRSNPLEVTVEYDGGTIIDSVYDLERSAAHGVAYHNYLHSDDVESVKWSYPQCADVVGNVCTEAPFGWTSAG